LIIMSFNPSTLPVYRSHKLVRAAKIAALQCDPGLYILVLALPGAQFATVEVSNDWLSKRVPTDKMVSDGYYVIYDDGYASWSPAEAFEKGHTMEPPALPITPKPVGFEQ